MQAYLGTIVCKFGGDPVICLREEAIYSADRYGQTDTTYHEPNSQYPAESWELFSCKTSNYIMTDKTAVE